MKKIILIILIALFASVGVVRAVDGVGGNGDGVAGSEPVKIVKLDNPIKANSIQKLLLDIVDLAIFLGTMVAVFVFVFIGFKLVMAQGNPKEIDSVKEWFKWAVIGTAILISSKVIVAVVANTLTSAGVVDKSVFNQSI